MDSDSTRDRVSSVLGRQLGRTGSGEQRGNATARDPVTVTANPASSAAGG